MIYSQLIQPALWALAGLACALSGGHAFRAWRKGKRAKPSLLAAAGAAAFALLALPSFAFVPAGHRGVVYEWGGGVNHAERGEGLTLVIPWVQTVRLMSVRTQKMFSAW